MSLNVNYFLYYDLFLLIFIVFILWRSYYKGFARVVIDLMWLVISFALALKLCVPMSRLMPLYSIQLSSSSILNSGLWFLFLNGLFRILYWIFVYFFSHKKHGCVLSFVNRIFGLLFGGVKVFLLLAILIVVLKLPIIENGGLYLKESFLHWVEIGMFILIRGGFYGIT